MAGVRAGETRQAEAQLSEDAPNVALRGQTVTAIFEVLEVKRLEMPELTPELLDELGGFELEADLRDAIQDTLQRRLEYQQRQRAREQITAALTVAADWELPPGLLQRQSQRELQRAVHGAAAQRLQRGRDPRPRERAAAEQPRRHGPGPERTLHPRADRRGPGDRRRRGRLRSRNPADRRPEQRVAAAGAGPAGKGRLAWTCSATRSSSGR